MEPTLIARLVELRTRLVGEGRVLDHLTVAQAVATLTASEADATRRARGAAEWAAGWWRSLGRSHGGNVRSGWREAVDSQYRLPAGEG